VVKKRGQLPWWELKDAEPKQFSPGTCVTHCGKEPNRFPNSPRWYRPGEYAISIVEGKLNVTKAVYAAFGRSYIPGDTVRHFKVGLLQDNEYWVYSQPSERNPIHGRISAPVHGTSIKEHRAWWDRSERVTLEALVAGPEVEHVPL